MTHQNRRVSDSPTSSSESCYISESAHNYLQLHLHDTLSQTATTMSNDGSLHHLCARLLLVALSFGSAAGWSVSAIGEQLDLDLHVPPHDSSPGAGADKPTCLPPQYPTKLSVCPETECVICYTTGQAGETVFNTTCSFAAEVSECALYGPIRRGVFAVRDEPRNPNILPMPPAALTGPFSYDTLAGQISVEQREQCLCDNNPGAHGTLP
jgi:hypothetical protein